MPHDKNGIEIKAGDIVRVPPSGYLPHEAIGSVQSIQLGADKCNLSVEAVGKQSYENTSSLPRLVTMTVTAAECEKVA